MTGLLITGLAAGLSSALLYAAVVSGSFLGILLFYLTSMPLLIAGLGWGWMTAIAGAFFGTLATAVAAGMLPAFVFLVSVGVPAAIISYMALLSRTDPDSGQTEWYPVGRIVGWAAIIAVAMAAGTYALIGGDLTSYRDLLVSMLNEMTAGRSEVQPTPDDINSLADRMLGILPAASSVVWLVMTLLNLYAAGRVVRASGRLGRPWPDIARMELPLFAIGATGAGLALWIIGSFTDGGLWFVGSAAAAVFVLANALVGLGVVHVLSRRLSVRGAVLAGLYASILLVIWPLVFLALVGLAEPILRLRDRQPQLPST
ncbi:MAG: DUF2232 domain-containing protein [Rhodobiaceae bacterium]|nr:DUF2232 domain-containing protein [Rhodobiaceae bacterium]